MIDVSIKSPKETESFFQYLASLPYGSSEPQKAVQWVSDNLNIDKASTVIGDVKFEIFAPTAGMRMLRLEKSK